MTVNIQFLSTDAFSARLRGSPRARRGSLDVLLGIYRRRLGHILSYSPRDKRLVNQWAADHTTTLAGGRPVLVLDMYEHACHMDYGAAAARYVDIYMEAIRWDNAAKLYELYSRES